ncbi:hypothetical protein [Salinivirga cyanobacteriivorans]
MNFKSLLRYIKNDVYELTEILGDLKPGKTLTEMDIKLIHSRIRSISEEFDMLENGLTDTLPKAKEGQTEKIKETSVSEPQVSSKKTEPTTKKTQPTEPAEQQEPTSENLDIEAAPAEKPEEPDQNTDPVPEEEPTDLNEEIEEKIQDEIEYADTATESDEPKKTIADKYTGVKNSINEKIAMHFDQKDLASKLQQHPIEDLTKAIKLNDKIWFINDLFEGNADLYRDTISKLNSMDDLESALIFLENNFDFDQDKESFKSFIEFIYRRYLK